MNPLILPAISAILLALVSAVMFYNYHEFRDEMFRNFGTAFILATLGRVITVVNLSEHYVQAGGSVEWVEQFAPLAFSGVSAVFLVIGALNGSRRYAETPYVMLAAIIAAAAYGSGYPPSSISYFIPTAFALLIGNLFAGIILLRKFSEDPACLMLYRVLGWLFIARGVSTLLNIWSANIGMFLGYMDSMAMFSIIISLGMGIVGFGLGRERARVRACQEIATK